MIYSCNCTSRAPGFLYGSWGGMKRTHKAASDRQSAARLDGPGGKSPNSDLARVSAMRLFSATLQTFQRQVFEST